MSQTETAPEKIPHPLFKVSFSFSRVLREAEAQGVSAALEELGVSISAHNREATDGDDWEITLTTYGRPDILAIYSALEDWMTAQGLEGLIAQKDVTAAPLPEKDWLRHVYDNFPPVETGRFFIHGSHFTGEKPAGLIPLQIDAATAFGSGEHETTKGCLLALEALAAAGHSFKNGLDMGCGSGILAIGMAKIWENMALTAIDISPESIIVTQRHAAMNLVEKNLTAAVGDGYATPLCAQHAPYDVITANILAGPLIAMAPDAARMLAPKGFCILSGLLARQQEEVTAAHTAQRLVCVSTHALGDWRVLVFQKKGAD